MSDYKVPDGIEEAYFEQVIDAVKNFKRSAWKPIVQEGDSGLRSSKFAGEPWLNEQESWPHCPNCGNTMQFFFQINLEEVSDSFVEKFGKGILQLFYCTYEFQIEHERPTFSAMKVENLLTGDVRYIEHRSCEGEYSGWRAFSQCQLIRIVQDEDSSTETCIHESGELLSKSWDKGFPARTIIGWQEINDYPSGEDMESLGIDLSPEDADILELAGVYPSGDRLAGWPGWVQGNECPDCPTCNQKMKQLIFTLKSNDNIPFSWGDLGVGYVLQCEEHKNQVAFLWQCG